MTIDHRTRLHKNVRALERDEVFDELILPDAFAIHGDLAGRGAAVQAVAALGSRRRRPRADAHGRDRSISRPSDGIAYAGVVAALDGRCARPTSCRTPSPPWASP